MLVMYSLCFAINGYLINEIKWDMVSTKCPKSGKMRKCHAIAAIARGIADFTVINS